MDNFCSKNMLMNIIMQMSKIQRGIYMYALTRLFVIRGLGSFPLLPLSLPPSSMCQCITLYHLIKELRFMSQTIDFI